MDEIMRLTDRQTHLQLEHVSKLMQRLTCSQRYDTPVETYDDPFHELFIYCVIFNRYVDITKICNQIIFYRSEMALYFWNQCRRPLLTALIGVWIGQRLRKYFQKNKFNESLVNSFAHISRYEI